jgi:hypothetical protein
MTGKNIRFFINFKKLYRCFFILSMLTYIRAVTFNDIQTFYALESNRFICGQDYFFNLIITLDIWMVFGYFGCNWYE